MHFRNNFIFVAASSISLTQFGRAPLVRHPILASERCHVAPLKTELSSLSLLGAVETHV